jgi:hypothetical protein
MHCCTPFLSAALLLFNIQTAICSSAATSPSLTTTPAHNTITNATCEARTINYITHRLPQQCLKSSWQGGNASTLITSAETVPITTTADTTPISTTYTRSATIERTALGHSISETTSQTTAPTIDSQQTSAAQGHSQETLFPKEDTPVQPADSTGDVAEESALDDASFLSFEDWKKQNLERSGQSNENIGNRKHTGSGLRNDRSQNDGLSNALDSLGDEGEMDLDFGVFNSARNGEPQAADTPGASSKPPHDGERGKRNVEVKRSKDAGTTCKERSNFVSADCGAAVLHWNSQAKSPKAVLTENKDSYMLNICSASNKFLIVEMCDDILVDTVVLANFEFFSSQFRQFRVSVSDRYPVKLDKWKEIGTFEAKNARGIQAFAVTEPRIWARYIRLEFLSHFGNEYYCPVSVLRVHGTTMISEFRAEAASGEDEADDDSSILQEDVGEKLVPEAIADAEIEEVKAANELKGAQAAIEQLVKTAENLTSEEGGEPLGSSHTQNATHAMAMSQTTTPWTKPVAGLLSNHSTTSDLSICLPSEMPVHVQDGVSASDLHSTPSGSAGKSSTAINISTPVRINSSTTSQIPVSSTSTISALSHEHTKTSASHNAPSKDEIIRPAAETRVAAPSLSTFGKNGNATMSSTAKTTATSSSPSSPSPSTQESFFKTVHRRLQLLEANSTLSLKYIEEQSKILREAFVKVEKRQLNKTTAFLENLNSTVLAELRGFRQQYDQIWQSTVLELETQRDQSQREIVAVSARLTLLADEVIFQKRMSIVQSVLLLLCLGLVIFSRGYGGSYLDFPINRIRSPGNFRFGSVPSSPEYIHSRSKGVDADVYDTVKHVRDRSDDLGAAEVSYERGDSSPMSASPSESDGDDYTVDHRGGTKGNKSRQRSITRKMAFHKDRYENDLFWQEGNGAPENPSRSSSGETVARTMRAAQYERGLSPPAEEEEPEDSYDDTEDDNCDSEEGSPRLGLEASGDINAMKNLQYQTTGATNSLSRLPSPPIEQSKSAFSIARKPLPALPQDNDLHED